MGLSAHAHRALVNQWLGVIAVFHLAGRLRGDGARMHELPARTVAIARRVFARTDAIHIDWAAKQGRVENQPTTGTLPKQPRVIHSRRNARSTDDEAEGAVIHFVGDPERLGFAIARAG